jgi:hypothetical protein
MMMMMFSNVGVILPVLLVAALTTTTTTTRTFAVAFVPSTQPSLLGRSACPSSSTLLLAKFQYCSLTGTMIAKKAAAADGVNNKSQKNDKMIAQAASKKMESCKEEEDEFVDGIGYGNDMRGPLGLVAAAIAAPTWHTVRLMDDDDDDNDEPPHSPRSSSSVGDWDSSTSWYVFSSVFSLAR